MTARPNRRDAAKRLPNLADVVPVLTPVTKARSAIPLLYLEFVRIVGHGVEPLTAESKRAVAAALKACLGTVVRKGDLAAAGSGARWFVVLLVGRARAKRALIPDADLGIAAERLRRAVERRLAVRPRAHHLKVRCGWSVLELDRAHDVLHALRQAIRGAAVVSAVEERRAVMLATITHELRAPLGAILGYAERLRNNLDRLERLRSVDVIVSESRRLAGLCEGLIDIGAWTAGRLQLRRVRSELRTVVERAIEIVSGQARKKNVTIVASGKARVSVDRVRLLQVCINLLDNAVRYAPERSRISVAIGAGRQRCTISCTDRGAGFPDAVRRALGNPFVRGSDGRIGLGLTICKAVIEAHGGMLSVTPGRGGRVTVALPCP